MPRAWNALRLRLDCRREAFDAGLRRAGFDLVDKLLKPGRGDLLVIWNRYGGTHEQAQQVEAAGGRVLVAENGHLGKGWRDGGWISLAVGHHAGAGKWHDGGPSRWDGWGVELGDWKRGRETIVFAQRGIGEPNVAAPALWAESAKRRFGGRIRQHPALHRGPPLADDLVDAKQAITWNSGAALQALLMGVPVWYEFDRWIGAAAARPTREWGAEPRRNDAARLAMLQRLAWAMWRPEEIETGEAIATVLQ